MTGDAPMGAESADTADPRLTVAAVARRLGVAPATLRTWDRRYGLGPTLHSAGAHRRYSRSDLARLETMRRLILDGVPPGEAARIAIDRSADLAAEPPWAGPPGTAPPEPPHITSDRSLGSHHAVPGSLPPAGGLPPAGHRPPDPLAGSPGPVRPVPAHPAPGTGPGGRILGIPGGSPEVRGLARAAMALDAPAARHILLSSIEESGVAPTWDGLLRPVLVALGQRWEVTGEGVEVEHLLAETAAGVLRGVGEAPEPRNGRPVLLACAPDEQHSLPLSALAAVLVERGVASRLLGGGIPVPALAAAVRRIGPAVVMLWAHLDATADTSVIGAIPQLRPPVAVLVGGAGWAQRELPARARYVLDLTDAVAAIERIVG